MFLHLSIFQKVTLSTMKASRYVKPFEAEVDRWERTLSLIMEVVEMILTVQRQWMYLEVFLIQLYVIMHNFKERWRSGIVSILLYLRSQVRSPVLS